MATTETDDTIHFKILTITEGKDFEEGLEEKKLYLNSSSGNDNYLAYVLSNDGKKSALLLSYGGGDAITFYNSEDAYKISTRKEQLANASNDGLMSSENYITLKNLNEKLNINEVSSLLDKTNALLDEIIQSDPTNDKKYILNLDLITNLKDISDRLSNVEDKMEKVINYLDLDSASNESLSEYISQQIQNSLDSLLNNYINHTHPNMSNN